MIMKPGVGHDLALIDCAWRWPAAALFAATEVAHWSVRWS